MKVGRVALLVIVVTANGCIAPVPDRGTYPVPEEGARYSAHSVAEGENHFHFAFHEGGGWAMGVLNVDPHFLEEHPRPIFTAQWNSTGEDPWTALISPFSVNSKGIQTSPMLLDGFRGVEDNSQGSWQVNFFARTDDVAHLLFYVLTDSAGEFHVNVSFSGSGTANHSVLQGRGAVFQSYALAAPSGAVVTTALVGTAAVDVGGFQGILLSREVRSPQVGGIFHFLYHATDGEWKTLAGYSGGIPPSIGTGAPDYEVHPVTIGALRCQPAGESRLIVNAVHGPSVVEGFLVSILGDPLRLLGHESPCPPPEIPSTRSESV